jgi:hypothetical protein
MPKASKTKGDTNVEGEPKKRKFQVAWEEDGDNDELHAENVDKRRALRQAIYNIGDQIENEQEALQDVTKDNWQDILTSLNEAHSQINHTREAQADAKIMRTLAFTMNKRAKTLENSSRMSFSDFANAIKAKYNEAALEEGEGDMDVDDDDDDGKSKSRKRRRSSNENNNNNNRNELNWSALGGDVGQLFLFPIGFNAMLGPISKPKKLQKARVLKEKDAPVRATQLESIENPQRKEGDGDGDDDDDEDGEVNEASFQRIDRLDKECKKRSSSSASKKNSSNKDKDASQGEAAVFPVLDILFDKDDVVQTIENFFDMAFLIKEGEVFTQYNKKQGLPFALSSDKTKTQKTRRRQQVLTLSVSQLNSLSKMMKEGHHETVSSLVRSLNNGGTIDEDDDMDGGSGSGSGSGANPLHRRDPLYKAKTAREQSAIIDSQVNKVSAATKKANKARAKASKSQVDSSQPLISQSLS